MHIYDISPILFFITERDGVFCEVRLNAEETFASVNVTVQCDKRFPFTGSRLRCIDYDRLSICCYSTDRPYTVCYV